MQDWLRQISRQAQQYSFLNHQDPECQQGTPAGPAQHLQHPSRWEHLPGEAKDRCLPIMLLQAIEFTNTVVNVNAKSSEHFPPIVTASNTLYASLP